MEVDQTEFGTPQNVEIQQQQQSTQPQTKEIPVENVTEKQPEPYYDNLNDDQDDNFLNENYIEQSPLPVYEPTIFEKLKMFLSRNWKKILIVLVIILVVCALCKAKREGYIKIPFMDGTTGYIKQSKDKSENKASAIIEDAAGNVIYSQTTQPVSRINYDYEQMLPSEISHGGISVESL